MDEITRRARRAAERILEDERLTDNLKDEAAKTLIDWGIARAESIARTTEEPKVIQDQLQAVRRLMRYVNRWMPRRTEIDAKKSRSYLDKVLEQVEIAYGKSIHLDSTEIDQFMSQFTASTTPTTQAIQMLRALIEGKICDPDENAQERYGQEIYF